MVEHVSLDQTNRKMNKDENLWVAVHMTLELTKNIYIAIA
jgi:hypothetical protein